MQNSIMRPKRGFLSVIIVLTFASLVAGCSAVRLGYANGDNLVYWWMDRYVGFSDEQRPWVKDEIARFFDWHRRTQLPDYAQVLARTSENLERPVSPEQVQQEFLLIRERAARIVEHALPALTTLALSLSPQQIDNIERRFANNNDKARKEHRGRSPVESQQARFDKVMKQAEYWFGSFSSEQRARIRAASDARPLGAERWQVERERRQAELIALLRKIQAERPGRDEAVGMLRAYTSRVLKNESFTGQQHFFETSRAGMADMTAQIINLAGPAQKSHATRRLQGLIDDGYALAGMRPPQQLSQAD